MAGFGDSPRRKRIRLDPELYGRIGTQAFITMTAKGRKPAFADQNLTEGCIGLLLEQARRDQVDVDAYCFMPDHVHLLIRVEGLTSITDFVREFKGRTTRLAWKHQVTGSLWQRSFYDHLLRETVDPAKYARYILENPVRRGLVEDWYEYPFSGSFTDDLTNGAW
jgi:putative transposase